MKELNPDIISNINIQFFLDKSDLDDFKDILIIKFSGKYRDGSQGNSDAQYMFAMGEFGAKLYEPFGIIIELSQLEYNWGDLLEKVFNIGVENDIHNVVIIGEKCKTGIGTLINGINDTSLATETEWIFDNYKEAKKYLEQKI